MNNVQVVQTKLANREVQLLYSGSDDGLINVYDLDRIGVPKQELQDEENLVKTRRARPKEAKSPVFLFSLNSILFTGLKKNKKVNSINVSNKRGLILGGCYGGDLLIWRNDNYRREKVVLDGYELVSKIKAHGQTLHLISMSPDENYFLTGSVDGAACVWKQPETAAEINELI